MIRVFPRKTEATPTDDHAFFGGPELWRVDGDDRDVFVSVAFTYDKPKAEFLAKQWDTAGYHVSVGGPAYDARGGEFIPGRFVKKGMIITSRGCNNKCGFCSVPRREGHLRELEVKDGYDLLDNNLLQCSESHVRAVFEMLGRQDRRDVRNRKLGVKLTGGLEALLLKDWHVDLIDGLKRKPEVLYFAYDEPADWDPLFEAAKKMKAIGFTNQRVGCYVLMGDNGDTLEKAQVRLRQVVGLDMMPFAMLYVREKKNYDPDWTDLQREHTKPQITRAIYGEQFGDGLL